MLFVLPDVDENDTQPNQAVQETNQRPAPSSRTVLGILVLIALITLVMILVFYRDAGNNIRNLFQRREEPQVEVIPQPEPEINETIVDERLAELRTSRQRQQEEIVRLQGEIDLLENVQKPAVQFRRSALTLQLQWLVLQNQTLETEIQNVEGQNVTLATRLVALEQDQATLAAEVGNLEVQVSRLDLQVITQNPSFLCPTCGWQLEPGTQIFFAEGGAQGFHTITAPGTYLIEAGHEGHGWEKAMAFFYCGYEVELWRHWETRTWIPPFAAGYGRASLGKNGSWSLNGQFRLDPARKASPQEWLTHLEIQGVFFVREDQLSGISVPKGMDDRLIKQRLFVQVELLPHWRHQACVTE